MDATKTNATKTYAHVGAPLRGRPEYDGGRPEYDDGRPQYNDGRSFSLRSFPNFR